MVSKGSSQNMGVFGIVNSHEARLMKPLGKPQKRSYSMPGKTGYPQSPWCLQYLAGDFQQKNWDDPHRPLFLGWVEVISHGRRISPWHGRWLLHDFPAEEYEICWWVFQSVVSVEYFWLSWQAYQKSPSVFGCFPPFNPTESITAQEKYQKPVSRWDATGRDGMIWRPTRYCWEWEYAYETSMNVGTKRVSKNKPPPSTAGGLLYLNIYI